MQVHPFLYARVLSIFHVNAYFIDQSEDDAEPKLIQVLWVRWLEYDHSAPGGFGTLRPHRLKFTHINDNPFDFLAPEKVLRGVHLLPAYQHGRHDNGLSGYSVARTDRRNTDWRYFYIGMCVSAPY